MTVYYVLNQLGPHSKGDVLSFSPEQIGAGVDLTHLTSIGAIRVASGGEIARAVPAQIQATHAPQGVGVFTNNGVPDGTSYAGIAAYGSLCWNVAVSPPTIYVNTGTIATPIWTASGGSSLPGVTSDGQTPKGVVVQGGAVFNADPSLDFTGSAVPGAFSDTGGTASAMDSHADSTGTASGKYGHADSGGTASGLNSHADSNGTASGVNSHASAEGTASGDSSFSAGGVASGNFSFAAESGTASGNGSHANLGGTASGPVSYASGHNSEASAEESFAQGRHVLATAELARAVGGYCLADLLAAYAAGGGMFATPGDAQYTRLLPHLETTNATPATLLVGDANFDTSPTSLILRTGQTWRVQADIVASRADVPGTVAGWCLRGLFTQATGALRLVGALDTITWHDAGASTWDVALTPNGTQLDIVVTGVAATTIRWVATLHIVEVGV